MMDSSILEKQLSAIEEMNTKRQSTMRYAKKARVHLEKITDWTDDQAKFLADICVEFDTDYDVGTHLCLDWMLDNYIAMEFERRVDPLIRDIVKALIPYNERNKFEYHHDRHAFLVREGIFVFGFDWRDQSRYLCIDEQNSIFRKYYVRNIWRRKKAHAWGIDRPTLSTYRDHDFKFGGDNGLSYGDCRDPGHVLTYERLLSKTGKCDYTTGYLKESLRWFFEINHLHNQLVLEE